jgi:hypothetical protein
MPDTSPIDEAPLKHVAKVRNKVEKNGKNLPEKCRNESKTALQARKQQTETNKQSRHALIMADECKKNTSRPSRTGGANYQFKVFSPFGAEKVF